MKKLFYDDPVEHDGRNHSVQQRILEKHLEKLRGLMRDVKKEMQASVETTYALNLWCNHGKHRSVASAELFATVFQAMGKTVELDHKSLRVHRRCCLCRDCRSPGRGNMGDFFAQSMMQLFVES